MYKIFLIKALLQAILLENCEIKAEKQLTYPLIIFTNIRGGDGGGGEKGANGSGNNDAMRISTTTRRKQRQWGWYNDNEETNRKHKRKSSYNRGKDLYSSMLQKGTTVTTTKKQHESYRSDYDDDDGDDDDYDSFYDIPSSYLFMSENEEEEKIIRALSIPPLLHEHDELNDDSDEIIYDHDNDVNSAGYEDEQTLHSQNTIRTGDTIIRATATLSETKINHESPPQLKQKNATMLNDNNSTKRNFHEQNYNTTTSKSIYTTNSTSKVVATPNNNFHGKDHHDNGDVQTSGNSRNRNIFNVKDSIKQIRTSNNFINSNVNKATIDSIVSTVSDDVKKRQSPLSSSTHDPTTTLKQKQRRSIIPNFQKRTKTGTNTNTNLNLPIEIPQLIDDIRSRAAAKSSSKYSNRSNGFHLNFQPNHQGQHVQQKQKQQQQQQQQQQEEQVQLNQKVQRRNDFIQNMMPQRSQHTKATQHSIATTQKSQQQQQQRGPSTSATTTVLKTVNKNKAATTMSLTTAWARKFILSRPKDSLLPIPREFLTDGFNLVQLAPIVESIVRGNEERSNHGQYQHNYLGSASTMTSSSLLPYPSLYKAALRLILEEDDSRSNNFSQFNSTKLISSSSSHGEQVSNKKSFHSQAQIQKAAEVLYTLVHARYVSSPRGLDTIRRMFLRNYELGTNQVFGKCPRVTCNGTPLLPFGYSDHYDIHGNGGIERKSMRYCCCCGEVSCLH